MAEPRYYVLICTGLAELEVSDPFSHPGLRDMEARQMWNEECDPSQDAVFWMDISETGQVTTGSYTNAFMEDTDGDRLRMAGS